MGKWGSGYVYEQSGAWHLQFYQSEVRHGKVVRVRKSRKLCEKDREHGLQHARKLARAEMGKADRAITAEDMKVTDFWDTRFLPYCEEIVKLTGKPRRKTSTMRGYKQIWRQHLKAHFANRTLQQYEPRLGKQLLRSLTTTQGKTTLKHIKAVASSIFKLAVDDERIKMNPWKEVGMPQDAIESAGTEWYTLEESEDMITALVDHVDAQLVLALSCFLALGPAEIGGLQWGDIDDVIHIRRNLVRGEVTTPKTKERAASVPILDVVRVPLELWRAKSEYTSDGASVIPDLPNLINRVIKPHVSGPSNPAKLKDCVRCKSLPADSGVKWKGLYAGRRGACTAVIEATGGNAGVAQRLLRHKTLDTTLRVYNKGISPQGFTDGMNLFAKKLAGK